MDMSGCSPASFISQMAIKTIMMIMKVVDDGGGDGDGDGNNGDNDNEADQFRHFASFAFSSVLLGRKRSCLFIAVSASVVLGSSVFWAAYALP